MHLCYTVLTNFLSLHAKRRRINKICASHQQYPLRCFEMSAGFRLVNTKCMMLVDMWKKIQHSNAVTLREVFTTKAFGDHCTHMFVLATRRPHDQSQITIWPGANFFFFFFFLALVFSYDFHAGAETMFSRHFNDPAADSYFTKRKWGELVFSLFFGPTVFGSLLHFCTSVLFLVFVLVLLFVFFACTLQFPMVRPFLKKKYLSNCLYLCLLAALSIVFIYLLHPLFRARQRRLLLRMFWFESVYFWQLACVRFLREGHGGGAGGFEETVAETKPVAGATWPTYRNTHRGNKTIQTPRLSVSGENATSKPWSAPCGVRQGSLATSHSI